MQQGLEIIGFKTVIRNLLFLLTMFFSFFFSFLFLLLLFDRVCHFRDNYYIPPKLVLFRFNQLRGRTAVTAHLTLD